MNSLLKFFFAIVGLLVHKSTEKFHDVFQVCHVKDPGIDSCLDQAIEHGIKLLKGGFPDFNLPPLDPYHFATLTVGAGTGAVNLVQNYKDITVTGFADMTVNGTHVDFKKKTLRFSTYHPLVQLKAHYDISGKVLMLPVHGSGPCTLTMENLYFTHLIELEDKEKQGEMYTIPKSYKLKMNPNHASYLFENLFDGNKLLGDNINNLINQEWQAIFTDIEEGYEQAYAAIFMQYAKSICEKVPKKDLLPE